MVEHEDAEKDVNHVMYHNFFVEIMIYFLICN
jgi:hypothetical protein